MPIITKQYSEHQFSGTNSSWSNMSGTNAYTFFTTVNQSNSSQAISYSTANGLGTLDHTPPAYGNTIVNFVNGVTDANFDFVVTPTNTPAANRLVLIAVESQVATGTAAEPTVSGGCGLTWTKVDTRTFGIRRITLFKSSGASPTNGNFTFNFGTQAQSRVYVWGYDFVNTDYSSAGSGVSTSNINNNASAASLSLTITSSGIRSERFVYFIGRSATGAPTSSYDNWTGANSQGVGNYLTSASTYQVTYGGTSANAMIGVSIVPVSSESSAKTYICSSGSTPATLANGSLKMGFPLTLPAVAPSGTSPATWLTPFFWSATSTAVDTTGPYYYPYITVETGKGADNSAQTADDTATITFAIRQIVSGTLTTLVSTSVVEAAPSGSMQHTAGEIWDIDFKCVRYSSTQSFFEFSWDAPPPTGSSTRIRGSISSGLINTPSSDLAFGLFDQRFTVPATYRHSIDYLVVSDYSVVQQAKRLQGVNRSVVW